jgi:heat shock protein HtpX
MNARTSLLLAGSVAIAMVIGLGIGGNKGMWAGCGFAVLMAANSYWRGEIITLRAHQARQPDGKREQTVASLVRMLAERAKMPAPMVWFTDNPQPNAFACGRSPTHSSIVITTGLLDTLSKAEIIGVIAHELAHINNRDTLMIAVSSAIAGMIAGLGAILSVVGLLTARRGGFFAMVVGVLTIAAAALMHLAIGRSREFMADKDGADLCGHPEWMMKALRKLADHASTIPNITARSNPGTIPLFTVNPVPDDDWFTRLFSTHPPMEERIARLQAMIPRP